MALVSSQSVDVIVVVESGVSAEELCRVVQENVSSDFQVPPATLSRFVILSRVPAGDLSEAFSSERLTVRRLRWNQQTFSLGVVHCVDKRNFDEKNQQSQAERISRTLVQEESRAGHDRTLLIGDFNMNPFDGPMTLASGFNAMMTTACVAGKSRIVQGERFPFFYNPMWGLFGDRTEGPAGTYHNSSSTSGTFGWNILDQVLLRPSILSWFDDVEVLKTAGAVPLETTKHRPDRMKASDHFPLLVTLKVSK